MPEVCGLIDESGCKVRGCTVADAGAAQAFAVEEFGGRCDAWGEGVGGWGLGVGF